MPIRLEHVDFAYADAWGRRLPALQDIHMEVGDGECAAIVGATGSGKTTLVQLMAGLLRPSRGRVIVDGEIIDARRPAGPSVRRKVGLVLQYPEHQLFAETVYEDIAFAPRNLGFAPEEVERRVQAAMEALGLPEGLRGRSPFSLSGGQKRRVAIAGVLAMAPRYLILDEPTAGLDAAGRSALMALLRRLHATGITLVVVTHEMDLAAALAQRVIVLQGGRLVAWGPPQDVLARPELSQWGLIPPAAIRLLATLRAGGLPVPAGVRTMDEACCAIAAALAPRGGRR